MLFSLDVIRAGEGDCMILHYGPPDDPRIVLIDGGPSGTYGEFLKPRLEQIKRERERRLHLTVSEPLPIELLMVSHMDDDHIVGVIDLTKDLIQGDRQFAQVRHFWHNSFENVIGEVPPQLEAAFTASFGAAALTEPPADLSAEIDRDEKLVVPNLKLLASIQNGAQLRTNIIDQLKSEPNAHFGNKLIAADEQTKPINIGNGLKFTVVGPMLPELRRLHEEHQAWLESLAREGQTAEDVLAAYTDRSPTNRSSIVVLAEAEAEGKRILFTGDAVGNKVLKGLELAGVIEEGGSLHVDVLKVPHHGSDRNAAPDFYERLTADHYVYSGDGKHGNPERASFEWLLAARGEDDEYTIHLTYPVSEIDEEREKNWQTEQKKDLGRQKKNPAANVRPDWSPEQQSLSAFFREHRKFARKLSIVEEEEPHVIDLLEEVGF